MNATRLVTSASPFRALWTTYVKYLSNAFDYNFKFFIVGKSTNFFLQISKNSISTMQLFPHMILSFLTSLFFKSINFFFSSANFRFQLLNLALESTKLKSHRTFIHVLAHASEVDVKGIIRSLVVLRVLLSCIRAKVALLILELTSLI